MNTQQIIDTAEEKLIHTYNRYQIVLDKGDGVRLYDTDGKEYLDFGAGIAVFALGYNNREYNDALKCQIDKLVHTSNYFYNEPAVAAAQALTKASGMDRVFFTNSGTEAVEGAVKLAKKYYYVKNGTADAEIIAMQHSFHGRSMGALAVTGNKHYQEAFGPMIPGIKFAQYNNLDSVKELVNDKTCAIIFETVQGEGGIYPATKEFIEGLLERTGWKPMTIQHLSGAYSIEWGGQYNINYLNQLYANANIYLDRKYQKYLEILSICRS